MRTPATLRSLAERCGIQTSYIDSAGKRREASIETLRALLQVWGVPCGSENQIVGSLAALKEVQKQRIVPPVVIQWDDRPTTIFAGRAGAGMRVRITPSTGEENATAPGLYESSAKNPRIVIPAVSHGYYRLEIECGSASCESLLISAPSKAYSPRGMRQWGVFLPMYAAWRPEPGVWAGGTFPDFARLADRIGRLGGNVVSTLPLTAAFLDDWKSEPSPYSPASRLFWNEFFVDPTAAPEFGGSRAAAKLTESAPFKRGLAELRSLPAIDYNREMALKRKLIEKLSAEFFSKDSGRRASFEFFARARPELERYAVFRAVCERQQRSWHAWPERLKNGSIRPSDYSEAARQYHLYAQWLAQQQIDQLVTTTATPSPPRGGPAAARAQLYLDLPLGVNPDGYDVWRERERFVLGASVGAPPDAFFTKGQDWGFPPLHPERIREDGYRYVIDYLRFQMSHTSLLRLDHVMGLHRLWWVPQGASAGEGAYVRYRAEELYAILSLESHRQQTMLVGENLGTVPPQVNRALKKHGVRAMYVVQYEAGDDPRQPLREPPRECVASINTHDMPAWASHWEGRDIVDRRELGLLKTAEVATEAKRRARNRSALERFLKARGHVKGKADARTILEGLLRFLAGSKAELVLANLEDLWLEPEPQNTPGTSTERLNWRRKTRESFETMLSRDDVSALLKALKR